MKIDHISMFATRPEEVKSFYEKYFGAQPEKSFKDEETGLQAYNMVFDDGAKLEIIDRPELQKMMKKFLSFAILQGARLIVCAKVLEAVECFPRE